jgi:hypothetical protein
MDVVDVIWHGLRDSLLMAWEVCLFSITRRRGVTDPVCGMPVDRSSALTLERDGRT